MPSALPIPKYSAGRTFLVAMSLLVGLAVCQLVAVAWFFLPRFGPALRMPSTAVGPALPEASPGADLLDFPSLTGVVEPPFGEAQAESAAPTPVPVVPGLQGLAAVGRNPAQTRVGGLVAQARAVREAGDMSAALAKLREALALAPQDPLVLSELAQTYERMGLRDKAAEHWRRVLDLGEQAGALLDLAQIKLDAAASAVDPEAGSGGSSMALTPGRDDQGLQPGSSLGLIDVRLFEDLDPTALRKLRLRLGLKARQGETVDAREVVIQVFFYDLIDGQHIVQTNAEVGSEWTTQPANWSDDGIEVLQVTYRQPKATEPVAEPENRRYLGHVIRVYYRGALQDMQADPVRLLTLYPPPLQLETAPPAP